MKKGRIAGSYKKYRSLIRQYLLFLLVPLVLGGIISLCVYRVTSGQMERSGELMVRHFQAQASGILREAQLICDSVTGDADIQRFNRGDAESRDLDAYGVCQRIALYKSRSAYVGSIYLINESSGYIYTSEGLYSYSSKNSLLEKIGQTSASIELGLLHEGWQVVNENLSPPFYVASMPGGGEEGGCTLVVTLQMTRFLHILYDMDVEMACLYNETTCISTIPTGFTTPDWGSDEEVSALLGKPVKCVSLRGTDFTYLVAISTDEYYAPVRVVVLMFSAYLLVVCLIGVLHTVRMSRLQYRNLAGLIESLPRYAGGDASYDEILQTVRSTLREYSENSRVDRDRAQTENLRNILLGHCQEPVTQELAASAGLDGSCLGYYVSAFFRTADSEYYGKRSPEEHLDLDYIFLRTALENLAAGKMIRLTGTRLNGNYIVIFCVHSDSAKPAVQDLVSRAVSILTEKHGIPLKATLSGFVAGIGALKDAYAETLRLNDFAHSVDSEAAVVATEELTAGVLRGGDFLKQIQILINTLQFGKYEMIPGMVRSIAQEHIVPLRSDYPLARERLKCIANILAENLQGARLTDAARLKQLRESGSVSRLNSAVGEVFGELAEKGLKIYDAVDRACAFIHDNITDFNLSVPVIAEAAGVSVQHLSRLFRQKHGGAILEYLNNYRVSLSKELLQNRKLTIAKVAEMVGFYNTETFVRNFRRCEGLTPTEYRVMKL